MRTAVAIALFAVATTSAFSQDDRRDRQDPELIVEAGGRSGPCDALLFNDKGSHLFAVGDDKVVRVWPCGPDGLDAAKQRIVRWPSWRERRGGIKALAISPDDKRIFVGGYGAKATTVAIIDPWAGVSGKIEEITLPIADKTAGATNGFAVMTAGFSNDGQYTTFGTGDGSVWLWKRGGQPERLGQHSPIPSQGDEDPNPYNRTRLSVFTPAGNVLSVAQTGEVLAFALVNGVYVETVRENLINLKKYPQGVFRTALSPDGKWLALGVNGPLVALCYLPDFKQPLKEYALAPEEFVRAITFSRDSNTLAVGVGGVLELKGFSMTGDDRILLFDKPLGDKPLNPSAGPKCAYRIDALTFHPDGRLAVAGGVNHEVILWDLKKPAQPQTVIDGKGRNLWGVRISADGKLIGYQAIRNPLSKDPNKRGKGDYLAFSLEKGRPVADKPVWIEPITQTASGWTVEPEPTDRYIWYAVNVGTKAKHRIEIDRNRDEAPQCWTFLPGDGKDVKLIVGHYYGCSIYDVSTERIRRRFVCIGHAGGVMAVAPSKDGTWFVTAGTDQTISAWSTADWKNLPVFGADLQAAEKHVLVKSVEPGSPAWEMGLIANDQIVFAILEQGKTDQEGRPTKEVKAIFNRSGVKDKKHGPETGTAAECIESLRYPASGRNYSFYWNRAGKLNQGVTSMPRRPVWRFFPAFDKQGVVTDWVVWLWWKPYYLTSAAGDSLLGISINNEDLTATPAFHRLDQFEAELHQRKTILDVLQTRNLEEILREARAVSIGEKEPNPVEIRAEVQEKEVVLFLSVKEKTRNPDYVPIRIALWINNYRFTTLDHDGKKFEKTVRIPSRLFHNGANQVTLQTFNRVGGRGEAQVSVEVKRAVARPRLFGLFAGINVYDKSVVKREDGSRGSFGNLTHAKNDALEMDKHWRLQQGDERLFAAGRQKLLLGAEVSRDAVEKELRAFAKEAKTDDLLVVFFSGHGDFVDLGDKKKASAKGGTFVFCCPDYNQEEYSSTGLPTKMLVELLADIPCRKLVLLDACRSGHAVNVNLARELVPGGLGMTIMTACDQGESAYESDDLNNGLFTSAVLEAMTSGLKEADANGNKDGQLDANELYWYVRNRMEALRKKTNKPAQSPLCFPFDPESFPIAR